MADRACCFFIVVLVPSDISTYIHNHTENDQGVDHIFVIKDETVIIQLWRLVYWVSLLSLPAPAGLFSRGLHGSDNFLLVLDDSSSDAIIQ